MKLGRLFTTFLVLVGFTAPVLAQTPVRINWTAVTGAQSGMFMAHQEGLFRKHGLDVELIHIPSSSRAIQAILAGEIAISFMDGSNATLANLKGANLALIAAGTNRQVFSLMAKPEFKRIADLKGKRIGITRIGSSTHTSALFALASAGLKGADYQLLPVVQVPNIFTALSAGQVDAGVMSPPTNARAKKHAVSRLSGIPALRKLQRYGDGHCRDCGKRAGGEKTQARGYHGYALRRRTGEEKLRQAAASWNRFAPSTSIRSGKTAKGNLKGERPSGGESVGFLELLGAPDEVFPHRS